MSGGLGYYKATIIFTAKKPFAFFLMIFMVLIFA
jgi:hypothetical protein